MTDFQPVAQDTLDSFYNRIAEVRVEPETANQYITWIERYEAWSDGEPTVGDLIDFDQYLDDPEEHDYPWPGREIASYAYSTRLKAISALKLWSHIQYDNTIEDEPQNIVRGDPEAFDPTILTEDEVKRTIENCSEDCGRPGCEAALRVSYNAILRAVELTRIEFEDFDAEEGTLYVRAAKGSRNATLQLDDEKTVLALQNHWDEYEDERKKPFYNSYGRPWKPNAWVQHFLREHNEAGSHSFGRHSPITHRLNDGESFGDVYRRARHHSPDMTARYARLVGGTAPDWADGDGL